uniref:Uncharacterized protein n=1 Tax=Anguilla anguilla TaxID=7936 RepID=A0A0E9R097_ANGAN
MSECHATTLHFKMKQGIYYFITDSSIFHDFPLT